MSAPSALGPGTDHAAVLAQWQANGVRVKPWGDPLTAAVRGWFESHGQTWPEGYTIWAALWDGYGEPTKGSEDADVSVWLTFETQGFICDPSKLARGYLVQENPHYTDIAYHVWPDESLDDLQADILADLHALLPIKNKGVLS